MNHIYRVVFNVQLGLWQALCECARARQKPLCGWGVGRRGTVKNTEV